MQDKFMFTPMLGIADAADPIRAAAPRPTTAVAAGRCGVRGKFLAAFSLVMIGATGTLAAPPAKPPEWRAVDHTVKKALAKRAGYEPKDLLAQGDLKAVVAALGKKGWKVADAQRLIEDALPDDDILVQLFRGSKKGVGFMRGIEKYALAYDRLDRLIRLPGGEMTIKYLIKGPDGYKMVQYFTETAYRGNCIVDILPRGYNGELPSSKGFNDPTGKIYTEKMLLGALRLRYDRQFPPPKAAGRETVYPR
jgi:hypothetical protein